MISDLQNPEFLEKGHELINFYRKNPEIGAKDLLNVDLSDIQEVVLRDMWFKNYVLAIMGRGAGKTFLGAVLASLKGMLFPGQRIGLIAPTFRQSKNIHDEIERIWQGSAIFRNATIKKPTQQSDNCYTKFKSVGGKPGSVIQALPLGDGNKIRGSRFFTIICDEFPHIPEDIFNMVIRPMGATVSNPMLNVRRLEKRKELLAAGIDIDEEEEAGTNQIVITSSGYFTFNHMYGLYLAYKEEMLAGNSKFSVFRIPYTLLPEGFLDVDNVETARKQMSSIKFSMEYEAAFISDSAGFYRASLLEQCTAKPPNVYFPQLEGTPGKSYILGVDPARTEDSFALCIVELGEPSRLVHALEFRQLTFPEMTSVIEQLSIAFNFKKIYMDSGGGGLAIKDFLATNLSALLAGPILDCEDEIHLNKNGQHILKMYNFTVQSIEESNNYALKLLEHGQFLFPALPREDAPFPAQEKSWETIEELKNQLQLIVITETKTGKQHFDVPQGGGHEKQKKDLYTAFILAARAVYDELFTEGVPQLLLSHSGVVKPRPDSSGIRNAAARQELANIPQVLQDKLEIARDPEAYRRKLLNQMVNRRPVLTNASAAVLKKRPKGP